MVVATPSQVSSPSLAREHGYHLSRYPQVYDHSPCEGRHLCLASRRLSASSSREDADRLACSGWGPPAGGARLGGCCASAWRVHQYCSHCTRFQRGPSAWVAAPSVETCAWQGTPRCQAGTPSCDNMDPRARAQMNVGT